MHALYSDLPCSQATCKLFQFSTGYRRDQGRGCGGIIISIHTHTYSHTHTHTHRHADREAEPKDYDVCAPGVERNLLRATYMRIGNIDGVSYKHLQTHSEYRV